MANHPHNSKRPEPKAVVDALDNGDIEAVVRALSVRQRRFAEEYTIDFNGCAAAIRAGYSTKHADKQAYLLLKHRGVSAYIDELTRSKEAKIQSVDPDYIIQQVTTIISKPGAKDSDRLRGLELLARHLGMFVDRTELTGKDGGPLEIEQRQKRAEEDAQSFTRLIQDIRERHEKEQADAAAERR